MFYQTQTTCRLPKGQKMSFLSLVTLTFDLDIWSLAILVLARDQARLNSLWIWRESIQQLPGYFIHKQKSHSAKNCSSQAVAIKRLADPSHSTNNV